jgi:hypothetical protein
LTKNALTNVAEDERINMNPGCFDKCAAFSSATRLSCFQDPWLCVTGSLRLCPFGDIFIFWLMRSFSSSMIDVSSLGSAEDFKLNIFLDNKKKRSPRCRSERFSSLIFMKGLKKCALSSSATRLSRLQDPWLCVTGLLRFCPFGR